MEVRIGEIGIFSLGAPGGVFLSSIAFGVIGKMGPFNFRVSGSSVNSIRDISLGTYLGMVGLVYGYRVVQSLAGAGIFFAFASFAVGLSCVTVGFLIGHYIFRLNWILLSGAICGGMTSNPGLGVASNIIGSDDPAAGYAAAYPFSITGMVIFTVLMYAL
jgi:putative transport protein